MQAAYSAWPVPPASNWVMKSWSNKTRLTNSALHSTLLRSSARLETSLQQRVQHSGNQYSRNTSHVKQYIREGGPTSQQRSDSVSTPPTPHQAKIDCRAAQQSRMPCSAGEWWSSTSGHQRLRDPRGQGDYQRGAMLFKIFFGEHEH